MPSQIIFDETVTEVTSPVTPCGGTDFTVSWQEKNTGDEASADYQDIFDLDDQGTGNTQTLDCGGLAPGATAQRTLTFNLPAGNYNMSLVINGGVARQLGNVIIDDCTPDDSGSASDQGAGQDPGTSQDPGPAQDTSSE